MIHDAWTDRLERTSLPQQLKKRLCSSRQVFLAEVKPGKDEIEHGLGLHYDSVVADAQGSMASWFTAGVHGRRLQRESEAERRRLQSEGIEGIRLEQQIETFIEHRKTLESAFDPDLQQQRQDLYQLTNVAVATQDVTGPEHNDFDTALVRLAQARLAYDGDDVVGVISQLRHLQAAIADRTTGIFLHLAGVGAFAEAADPLRNLDLLYALGIRMAQLTYIQKNKLCSSWLQGEKDTGLTQLGCRVVRRMNELGIMVDIAHCGVRSAMEIMAASNEPVLLSHTACLSVYDDRDNTAYLDLVLAQPYARGVSRHKLVPGARNASDELLSAVGRNGGIAALYNIHHMLAPGENWSYEAFSRHLDHAVEQAGIDHVAFGTDRTVFPTWQPHACEWSNWPYYTVALVCRGYSDAAIRKIIGGNFTAYAERILNKKPWGICTVS